ncbi:hypothetical protein [Streptomyces lushanensis]|uniref:hypothetical protein n=1 Tax=Streptomyces lushanensis TaxID=1434255 RepID=UPI001474840C|nr:hypothetical protein [Streptomyces lushanensis]
MIDALAELRYDIPGVNEQSIRIALARLLSLYSMALKYYDQPVIDLVDNLRSEVSAFWR